jgi:GT2 family glycosyltransferase
MPRKYSQFLGNNVRISQVSYCYRNFFDAPHTFFLPIHANIPSTQDNMSLHEPFFTVILCAYNRAVLLPRALDSLLGQEEQDWEAIIVNDGSTDDTYTVAHEYLRRFRNIRYMEHQNHGVGYSRTAGIYAALGRYCTFLDSDDEYLPEHLTTRKHLLLARPETDILHGGVEVIGNPFVTDRHNPQNLIHISQCVMEGTMVIRRETARELGGFGTARYAEGAAFMEKARAKGCAILHTDLPTYRYDRTTPDSLCTTAFQGTL